MKLIFNELINIVCYEFALMTQGQRIVTTTIHSHGFVMALLQWHRVYKLVEDEPHKPPVMALRFRWNRKLFLRWILHFPFLFLLYSYTISSLPSNIFRLKQDYSHEIPKLLCYMHSFIPDRCSFGI